MRDRRFAIIAWVFFGLICVSVIAATIYDLSGRPTGQEPTLGEISIISVPLAFAFVGALIISRQPRNVIGLLMMLPGISLFVVVDAYLRPFIHGYAPVPESSKSGVSLDLVVQRLELASAGFPAHVYYGAVPNRASAQPALGLAD